MFMLLSVTAVCSLVLLLWRFEEKSPWEEGRQTEKILKNVGPGSDLEETI